MSLVGMQPTYLSRPANTQRLKATCGERVTPDDVLLLDAGMRQMLAATRSLGRRGLRVSLAEAFAEYDPSLPIPAFQSRYAASSAALPDFQLDPDGFGAALEEWLATRPTRVTVCGSDGAIAALRPWRERLEKHTRLALASDGALDVAFDKQRTLEVAAGMGIDVPRTIAVTDAADTRRAFALIGFPAVVKPCLPVVRGAVAGRLRPQLVQDARAGWSAVNCFLSQGTSVLIQPWVGGCRETVCVMLVEGRVHAEFSQVAARMTPVLGGASTMRESIPLCPELAEPTLALLRTIGLDGYAEAEFRRDQDGKPRLMEINARLSGSVEIAQRAGVDFPSLVWQWAAGEPVDTVTGYRSGVRLRWLRGDYAWLRENMTHSGNPDGLAPRAALRAFARDFLRPVHYDYMDRRDLGPLRAEVRSALATARRKLSSSSDSNANGKERP